MDAVRTRALDAGCGLLWVVTTNDNVDALRFYQRRGFRLARLRPGAVDESRETVKPEIPAIGDHGIPLRDEIELRCRWSGLTACEGEGMRPAPNIASSDPVRLPSSWSPGPTAWSGPAPARRWSGTGATVRAVVRRPGAAPALAGVEEWVGDFQDAEFAGSVVQGASAVVTTVHPMGSDRATQHRIAVEGTPVLARAARDAGVARLVHVSTAAVYDRSPGVGDVDESSPLVADDANAYAATKRDTDAALGAVDGITRVILRPPAILGAGETLDLELTCGRPRSATTRRLATPCPGRPSPGSTSTTWPLSPPRVASGRVSSSTDPETGPVDGGCTVVNVAADAGTVRDYYETVTTALGLEPVWDDAPAWTGRILADRARRWGWAPTVDLPRALAEIADGLRQ